MGDELGQVQPFCYEDVLENQLQLDEGSRPMVEQKPPVSPTEGACEVSNMPGDRPETVSSNRLTECSAFLFVQQDHGTIEEGDPQMPETPTYAQAGGHDWGTEVCRDHPNDLDRESPQIHEDDGGDGNICGRCTCVRHYELETIEQIELDRVEDVS